MAETKHDYSIETNDGLGEVQIADEVVAIIAALAAMEVKGVSSMAGNITSEVINKLGVKNLSKGVKIVVDEEDIVRVALSLNLDYGYNVPETSAKVQRKVKQAIETMTGLEVSDVNVRIAGVNVDVEE